MLGIIASTFDVNGWLLVIIIESDVASVLLLALLPW